MHGHRVGLIATTRLEVPWRGLIWSKCQTALSGFWRNEFFLSRALVGIKIEDFNKNDKRCLRLVKYIGQIDESERTDKQRTSIKWVTSILVRDTSADQQSCVKRQ